MTPLLTIGIPVYNEEHFLAKTIESALNQTFADFHLIISDNCSTDRSFEIAQAYAKQDKRITVVRHAENLGAFANFHYSLDRAETKYFVWLGAHDLFLPDYLRLAIEVLEGNPDIVLVAPKAVLIDANDVTLGHADSDIDTRGLLLSAKLFKVAENLTYCTSIHGVFRTEILRMLPFKAIIGGDHLLLFTAALYGDLCMLDQVGIHRREKRLGETDAQIEQRRQADGVYQKRADGLTPYAALAEQHLLAVWRHHGISFTQKVDIMRGVQRIFSKRFRVKWSDVARQHSVLFNQAYLLFHRLNARFHLLQKKWKRIKKVIRKMMS